MTLPALPFLPALLANVNLAIVVASGLLGIAGTVGGIRKAVAVTHSIVVRAATDAAVIATEKAAAAWRSRADALELDLADARRDIDELKADAAQRDLAHAHALRAKDRRIAELEAHLRAAEAALATARLDGEASLVKAAAEIAALKAEIAVLKATPPVA